jgi:molybdate transport system substrate-binding protein
MFIDDSRRRLFRNTLVLILSVIAMVFIPAGSCYSQQNNSELLVSAAASLKNAFKEIGSLYEKQTGIRVQLNLGASGLLQKQIETGAPVDVFASAGEKQVDELQGQGLIIPGSRRNFARNALVLILPEHSTIAIRTFQDLARPEITRLAIGNPKTVPAGQYAQELLKNLKLLDILQTRLVLAENVSQVLDYVERGEVDAGIVYASDVTGLQKKVEIAAHAPKGSHAAIIYPIAVIRGTENRIAARRFIDLILSSEGQAILIKSGFLSIR